MIPVTSRGGERVYCQLLDDEVDPDVAKNSRNQRVRMLSKPISALLDEVENDATAAALRETARLDEASERQQVS